jgi:transcriptional regulator with XRE-family HTH domain
VQHIGRLGYTQEQLAAALGVERTTVGRWEAGENSPQPWCRPKRAQALDVSVDELDTMLANGETTDAADDRPDNAEHDPILTSPWSQRGTLEAPAVLSESERVKRREFGFLTGMALTAPAHQWLVREPGPLVSGLSGRRVSAALADRFMAMIAELRAMDDLAGGGTVLALAEHEFGVVAALLNQASYDEATGGKLHGALAELGRLAGWGAYDFGQPGLAQRYNIAALRAAHTVNDRPLGARILGYMAYQAARQGRPAEAVTLIETGLAGIRGRETPALLAELYGKQADAFATLRDSSGCTATISKARSQIEHLSPEDDLPSLYWVTPAEITAYAGQCHLQLGHTAAAITLLDEGLALFDESFTRNRQAYLTHSAKALLRPGQQHDLDTAAARGMEAIDIAESLHSTYSVEILRNLYHQMTPHATVPSVADFLERAQGFVTV